MLRSQSDERLVALSREGRDAAFEEIVRRYRPGLVAFAAAYAPPDRAEDVVQESFVSSWDALRRSTEEIRLKPWLYTIVRNRALNARRDARPHVPLPEEIDGVREPPEIALTNEELERVVRVVGSLPQTQRQALVRSAIEGHTHEQIAASIGSSPGAVRQLIYRARLTVREGVGFLIPLPIVRMVVEAGPGETLAGGAVAGGAAIAGTAGGASALSKATVVAVVGTIAAASGVAIKRHADENSRADSPTTAAIADHGGSSDGAGRGASSPGAGSSGPSASAGPGSGDDGRGSSGPGPGDEDGDRSGPDRGSDDDGREDDSSGPSASSGPGSGEPEPDGDSSGPGSGDSEVETERESDNSGPGSTSSGSGSSGSGSSGTSGSGTSGSGTSGSGTDTSGSGSSGSDDLD